jgi:hypothetical protein
MLSTGLRAAVTEQVAIILQPLRRVRLPMIEAPSLILTNNCSVVVW